MTKQNAIERLTDIVTFCSGRKENATLHGNPLSEHDEEIRQLNFTALDMAISALEKQIAKKPLIVNGEFDGVITFEWKDYLCPVCKRTFISKCDGEWCAGRKVAHCECGQAICWED